MKRTNLVEGTPEEKMRNYYSVLESYSRLFLQKTMSPEEARYHIDQILEIFVSIEKISNERFESLPEEEQKRISNEFAEFRAKVKSWRFDQPVTKIVK